MPVDRDKWKQELHLSNFTNTFYQYRDLQVVGGGRKGILVIGPGQGLDTCVLKWKGYQVVTLDIDDTFKPDYQGSVHDMPMFNDGQFDVVIASHVLEHLSVAFFEQSLKEIARVGRYAIIYLPVHGHHLQLRIIPGVRALDMSFIVDVFNYFERPDGLTPRYMEKQHFWEVGMRGFRVKDILKRMSSHFEVLSVYRNKDWLPSQNFVLRSRRNDRNPDTAEEFSSP